MLSEISQTKTNIMVSLTLICGILNKGAGVKPIETTRRVVARGYMSEKQAEVGKSIQTFR